MPDSPITSRPATPESETPETDKFENNQAGQHDSFREPYYLSLKFARSLERRRSLAQTEIKGLRVMVDECHSWLEDMRRKNVEAQARIAELEKVLGGVLAEADRDTDSFIAARAALKDRA